MAIIDSKAGAVALANTATLNKLNDTLVPIWDLEAPSNERVPKAEPRLYTNPGDENVLDSDERVIVPPNDFGRNGKYRCKALSQISYNETRN